MFKSFTTHIKQLNRPSSLFMMLGLQFCCLLLVSTFIAYLYNDFSANYSFTLNQLCKTMASTVTLVFAEVIIGGLAMDCYEKKHKTE